jgi:hypothetical protein
MEAGFENQWGWNWLMCFSLTRVVKSGVEL